MGLLDMSKDNPVGIAAMGYYVPEGVMTSDDVAKISGIPVHVYHDKIGMQRKHIASADEHPTDMGIKASFMALRNAGLSGDDIDIVVYCGAGFYDYQIWCPSARVQDAIGASHCYGFEVRNGCNGGNLGLNLAKHLLMQDPEKQHALVVCADKLSILVDYRDHDSLSLHHLADGAAAALISKRGTDNSIGSYASITDGSIVDRVMIPGGGTRRPFHQGIEMCEARLAVDDPKGLDDIFSNVYLSNYEKVIDRVLQLAQKERQDIRFLFTNQVKKGLSASILKTIGLRDDQYMSVIGEYGHVGPTDTFFCLAKALESRMIQKGDLVVLASSGTGFTWGATTIQY